MIIFTSRILATVTSAFLFHLIMRRPKSKERIFFAVGILFVVFWNGFDALSSTLPNNALWESGARILVAMILTSVAFGAYFISLSSFYFDKDDVKPFKRLVAVLPILTLPFLWTIYIPQVEYINGIGWELVEDMAFFAPFIISVLIPMMYAFLNLYRIYKKVSEKHKSDMTYFLVGLFCVIFFPTLIDGILSMFTVVSYGSVAVAVGCIIMSVPYLKKRVKSPRSR